MVTLVDGRVGEFAAGRIEYLALRDWPRLPGFQLPFRRKLTYRRRTQRQDPAQDFDLYTRNGPAVEFLICVLEPFGNRWHISRCEFANRQIDGNFVTLSTIAHERGTPFRELCMRRAAPHDVFGFGSHFAEHGIGYGRIEAVQPYQPAAYNFISDRCPQQPDCGADSGTGWDERTGDPELPRHASGVQRRGATERNHCAGPDILAAFDRMHARGACHVLVDDLAGAERGVDG